MQVDSSLYRIIHQLSVRYGDNNLYLMGVRCRIMSRIVKHSDAKLSELLWEVNESINRVTAYVTSRLELKQ